MRVLVCGSRHFDNWKLLDDTLSHVLYQHQHLVWLDWRKENPQGSPPVDFTLIEGGAKGADFLARVWAKHNGLPVQEFPADWEKHGKAAGPIRNKQMLDEGKPDKVIAFLAKDSRGTANMIEQAQKAGIPVEIINVD